MLLQITNFPSHFFSLGHRESHSFIPRPHCYVHGAQVCHQMCFLKARVSAHVDAGTAGPHSRILPIAPSLQVAREVSRLEHTVLITLLAPTTGSLKAFSDEILVSQKVLSILSGHTALWINIIKVTSQLTNHHGRLRTLL